MVLAILLYIAVFTLFLFMGTHILLINPRSSIHIIFFSISLFLAESALGGGVLINYPGSHEAAQLWFKTSTALSVVLPSLFLVFAVEISRLIQKKVPLYTAVGAVTLYLLVRLLTRPDLVELDKIGGVWHMKDIHAVRTFFLYVAYYILATLGYFMLLLIWRKRTESVKEKRQAAILLLSYFTGMAPVLIILLLNYFGIIERLIAGFGIFFYPLWYIGVFYCIARFHFLSITPELVSRELIECIDESIILLDGNVMGVTIVAKRVNSRFELITILREYDLVPAEKADRTVLSASCAASQDEAI